ncbi:uncharacterized protein LOC135399940 [Ornithodoros turicata]|uniref:uncharacterized protein LOC135399940 n=1 Tax=Ornithodoros turicata TaxID=34597 RepID=UPI00313A473C
MNAIVILTTVASSLFAVASSSECSAGQVTNYRFQCQTEVKNMEDFKDAPALEHLQKSNPEHHKIGCCMEKALAQCYRKMLTGECAGLVDGFIKNNQHTLNTIFDGRRCDYKCPNGSYLLKPTWALVTAFSLLYFLNGKL